MPREALAEVMWGGSPPATWEKALAVLVSRLRGAVLECGFDGASTLTYALGCYRLDLPEPVWIDVLAADAAVREAARALVEGRLDAAVEYGHEALEVARRPFLAGEEGPWVEAKRRELADVADEALACCVDAQLAAGRHGEAARLAEEAIALQPFRESGYRRLMQAHAAAGNRAEALRVYDRCRRLLVDELGAYPSPETDSIFKELLREPSHAAEPATDAPAVRTTVDPSRLDAAADPAPAPVPSGLPPQARRRRSVAIAAGFAAAAVVVVAAFAVVLAGGGDAPRTIGPNSVASIDAASGRTGKATAAERAYGALAGGRAGLWATDAANNAAVRLDPDDGSVRDTIPVGADPAAVATGYGAAWVANAGDGTLARISERGAVVQTISVGNGPSAVAVGAGSVWVADRLDGAVARINPDNRRLVATIPLPAAPAGIAFAAGSLWVTGESSTSVYRIDPAVNAVVRTVSAGTGADRIAAAAGDVWVTNLGDGTVSRIDARKNAVTAIVEVGGAPVAVASGRGALWIARTGPAGLVKVDPRLARITRRVPLGAPPAAVTSAGTRVWVATRAVPPRGGTVHLTAWPELAPTVDPALVYDGDKVRMMVNVYDGLVAYRRVGGSAGNAVVPDLARASPAISDGGKTYRFQLRRGIRYSDGTPVRARDFKHTLARLPRVNSPGAGYFAGVRSIATDDSRGTVVFHLRHPDPEFVTKLALPFAWAMPSSTPMRDIGTRAAPGTGPYRIDSFVPRRQFVLARNPYFRTWSSAAQPPGSPDRIAMKIVPSADAVMSPSSIEHSDVVVGRPSQQIADRVLLRYPARTRSAPIPANVFMFLNTRIPPFDDLRVRRAVNYAVDRGELAAADGAPLLAQPSCQVLPPGLLGYRPYCRYTRGAGRSGVWTEPDLAKARRLVAESGRRGAEVTVWTFAVPRFAALARRLAATLDRIGLRSKTKTLGGDDLWLTAGDPRGRVQAAVSPWSADYNTPTGFLFNILDCRSFVPGTKATTNLSQFCDRRSQAAMDRALAAESSDIGDAGRLWTIADRRITDAAPVVPLVTPRLITVVSERVRNYQYHPVWGPLLDQLSVR